MAPPPDERLGELLAERDFVRALAARLVGAADADDLAQDVWLRALDRAGEARAVRPWLARITQRLASNRRRDASRRGGRERAAAGTRADAAPSTADVLACEESRRRVVEAVLALDEPFRSTVLARYYERLDSARIARRDGVAVATVRSRLKRAHERLRARLDAEHGGRRDAWAAPLAWLVAPETTTGAAAGAAWFTGMTTTKKVAGAVALVLLAGLAGWSWFANGDTVRPPDAAASPSARRGGASADGGATPGSRVAAASVEAGAPATAAPRDDAASARDVDVRVLDRATGMPVAGAELLYRPFRIDWSEVLGDRELQESHRSPRWLAANGVRVVSDPDGRATLRIPKGGTPVHVERGALRGRAHVRTEDVLAGEAVRIWVDVERVLRLRLVGPEGRPVAGELVELSYRGPSPLLSRGPSTTGLEGPSNADGLVEVLLREDMPDVRVRPWVVGVDADWLPIDLRATRGAVVDVPCPSTGTMAIELCAPSGERLPMAIDVQVQPVAGGRRFDENGPVSWGGVEPGIYRVAHVAVGRTYRVKAHVPSDVVRLVVERAVAGPRVAGEEVHVRLEVANEPSVVRATLRAADGRRLPEDAFALAMMRHEGTLYRTGRSGGVVCPDVLAWPVPVGVAASGEVRVGNTRPRLRALPWALDEPAGPGVHDLGVLRFEPRAVLVTGRVDVGAEPWRGPPMEVRLERQRDDGSWRRVGGVDVDPAHDPAFGFEGDDGGRPLRVSIAPSLHVLPGEPVAVEIGARDVVVGVRRGAPLRARVLAEPAHAQRLALHVRPRAGGELPSVDDDARVSSRRDAVLVDFDGAAATFAWPALPTGRYDVEVRLPGMATPLATVRDVAVGEGAPDARLDAIDVREAGRRLTVVLHSAAPAVAGGGAMARPSGGDGDWTGMTFDANGRAQLLLDPGPVDVLVAAPGHRLLRIDGVVEDLVDARPEPCLELPFRLAPEVAAAFAGLPVTVRLEPRGPADGPPSARVLLWRAGRATPAVEARTSSLQVVAGTGSCRLDDAAAAEGRVPIAATGRFEVHLIVHGARRNETITDGFVGWTRRAVTPRYIDVDVDLDPIEITVAADAIPKVLEALRR